MAQFSIPPPQGVKLYRMQDFLGVDFSSAPAAVDDRRSPDAYNFMHVNGQNVKRSGFELVHAFKVGDAALGAVNGMHEFGDLLLVHIGQYLFLLGGANERMLVDGGAPDPAPKLADTQSFFISFAGVVLILDGTSAWYVYRDEEYGVIRASTLYDKAYVPLTSRGRNTTGSTSVAYEEVNMITPRRKNGFLGSSTGKTYQLDAVSLDAATVQAKTMYLENGEVNWTIWPEYDPATMPSEAGTVTVNRLTGQVSFKTAPGVSPKPGEDNIIIEFSKTVTDYENRIDKCRFAAAFGTNGNSERLFASGNPDYPNMDWYCNAFDPTYWMDLNYAQVGNASSPIVGYTRIGSAQMGVHKRTSLGEQGVYYRTGEYDGSFEDAVFPIRAGYTDVEMLSMRTCAMLEGEPIFLSRLGVRAMVPRDTLTLRDYVLPNRSFYINNRLLGEENLHNATALAIGDRYYLAVNDHMYVADRQYKYYDSSTGKRYAQYEWYYWTDVPARCLCNRGDTLYFGDAYGRVYRFVEGQFWDYDPAYPENRRPVELLWTCPLNSLNAISYYKHLWHTLAVTQPYTTSECAIGYTVDGIRRELKRDAVALFSFDAVDLSSVSLAGGTAVRTLISRKNLYKFNFIQFYFLSSEPESGGLYALEIQYAHGRRILKND